MPMRWHWPARELVRVAVELAAREPDAPQHLDDLGAHGGRVELGPMRPERLADDVADRHARVQRRERILEHDLHVALQRPQLRGRELAEIAAEHGRRGPPSTGTSLRIARASVDLPLPDSPTMPSVSPGASVRSTPSTALSVRSARTSRPPSTGKCTFTPFASTSGRRPAAGRVDRGDGRGAGRRLVARRRVEPRHGREQRARVVVLRRVEDVVDGALLLELAAVHHEHAVREPGDHAEVVRDQDDRGAEAAFQILHELEDLRLHGHVERRGRLVGDQHLGPSSRLVAIITRWRMPPESSCG